MRLAQRIVDLLIAARIPLLLVAMAGAAFALFSSRGVEFDRSVENMFAADDPVLEPYRRLKRTFGGNEVVLAVYADDRLLAPDGRGMARLAEVSRALASVPGVRDVVSLDQPLGPEIVDDANPLARPVRELFEGYTHGADGRIAAVVCMLAPPSETDVPRREVIDRLRRVVDNLPAPLEGGMLAGEPVMVVYGFRYVEADGARLAWATTLLAAATILVAFRSVRWVIVALAVVQSARLLTLAVIARWGLRMSLVSSMLTAVVTAVGIATVVHVVVRFREARQSGPAPREALSRAGRFLAAPIFWSCSTTAVGFASLTAAGVGPVRDFGLMMTVGSLMVMVSVALVVPGLALMGRWDADPRRAWGEHMLDRQLRRVLAWAERRPLALGVGALVFTGAAVAGTYRLEVESDFTRNFRPGSPVVESYKFVEARLGGAGVWDVLVPAPEELDWQFLGRIRRLEERLRAEVVVPGADGRPEPGLTKVLSLADGVLAVAPVDPDRVPAGMGRDVMVATALGVLSLRIPALYRALYGEDPEGDGHVVRIMLRARERQPAARKQAIIARVERICREQFPPGEPGRGAEVTGFFVLLVNLVRSLLEDQWVTFAVATAGIGLMMTLAFRSPALALVALVPNVLPIAVVTGLMGWLGVKINMGAAMIAAVSIGVSVDSSIHYVMAFRRARDEGATVAEALGRTHQGTGRAMVFSVVALIVGFSVLATSHFVPTVYFGALISLAMLGGLAGNLVVLPLLVRLVTREAVERRKPGSPDDFPE